MNPFHELADVTGSLLETFAKNVHKLFALEHGDTAYLSLEYESPDGMTEDVFIVVERDVDDKGTFIFNEVPVGDLNEAMQFYALSCAQLIKQAGADEVAADDMEREDSLELLGEFQEEEEEDKEAYQILPRDDDEATVRATALANAYYAASGIHKPPPAEEAIEPETDDFSPREDPDEDEIMEFYPMAENHLPKAEPKPRIKGKVCFLITLDTKAIPQADIVHDVLCDRLGEDANLRFLDKINAWILRDYPVDGDIHLVLKDLPVAIGSPIAENKPK
jgi:hypothetical protein